MKNSKFSHGSLDCHCAHGARMVVLNDQYEALKAVARGQERPHTVTIAKFERENKLKPNELADFRKHIPRRKTPLPDIDQLFLRSSTNL